MIFINVRMQRIALRSNAMRCNAIVICEGGSFMINFEEELKNFKPSLEVEEAEQAIYNHELTDMTDVLQEMMREMKHGM